MLSPLMYLGLVGILAVGFRLLFEPEFLRKIIGLALLSHIANLLLLFSGETPPQEMLIGEASFLPAKSFESTLDPLPQAMVLTAIVISFALTAFLVIFYLSSERDKQ